MIDIKALTLEDAIPLMRSECFKDRLRAEYYQLQIRIFKLTNMIEGYKAKTLDYIPRVDLKDLETQKAVMGVYSLILENMCRYEGADLDLPLTYLYDDEEEDFDE